jgi:predicted transcriptional regulator
MDDRCHAGAYFGFDRSRAPAMTGVKGWTDEVSDLQTVLDALASPVRREILWRLWDEELPAGAVAAAFDVTAPTISEHLGVLRRAGLVTMRRFGNHRLYPTVRESA